jgi:hypothetical protein
MAIFVSRDWTVQRTLKDHPQLVPIFNRLKTDCVGCWLERFCTLEDVSSNYAIQIDFLLDSLRSFDLPGEVEEER